MHSSRLRRMNVKITLFRIATGFFGEAVTILLGTLGLLKMPKFSVSIVVNCVLDGFFGSFR